MPKSPDNRHHSPTGEEESKQVPPIEQLVPYVLYKMVKVAKGYVERPSPDTMAALDKVITQAYQLLLIQWLNEDAHAVIVSPAEDFTNSVLDFFVSKDIDTTLLKDRILFIAQREQEIAECTFQSRILAVQLMQQLSKIADDTEKQHPQLFKSLTLGGIYKILLDDVGKVFASHSDMLAKYPRILKLLDEDGALPTSNA